MTPNSSIKKVLGAALTALLTVALTLVAVLVLVQATLQVALVTSPAMRALAVIAELILGAVLLVGTIYLATHMAVRIFGRGPKDYPSLNMNMKR